MFLFSMQDLKINYFHLICTGTQKHAQIMFLEPRFIYLFSKATVWSYCHRLKTCENKLYFYIVKDAFYMVYICIYKHTSSA